MEVGQTPRPRAPVPDFSDDQPRKKCSFCCATRYSLLAGAVVLAITFPCNLVMLSGKLCDGAGWRGFVNCHCFIPLPFTAVVFTHQWILSESLWSKNRKSVLDINIQSTLTNIVLWCTLTGAATYVSRNILPVRSRAYRLLLWDYSRKRRSCANKYFPSVFGRLKEDMDWYNMLWILSSYHVLWGMVSVLLEKRSGAQFAIFFRDSHYSRLCSPRWREWGEVQMINEHQKEQMVAPSRWGNFLTNDKWKSRIE